MAGHVKKNTAVYIDDLKPTTGRGGNANFPSSRAGLIHSEEDRIVVSQIVAESVDSYLQPRVKSDEELVKRFEDYFKTVVRENRIPTIEDMYLYTGYGYSYILDIEKGYRKGFSPETARIIKYAREVMRTIDSKLVTSGKMNPIPYIFRAKNYYGMTDKTELQVQAVQPEAEISAEEIARRYLAEAPEAAPEADDA